MELTEEEYSEQKKIADEIEQQEEERTQQKVDDAIGNNTIKIIVGDNPACIYSKDGQIELILEERKIRSEFNEVNLPYVFPEQCIDIIRAKYGLDEPYLKILKEKSVDVLQLENKYVGLAYSKDYILNLVRKENLFYSLYILPHAKPHEFFDAVIKLVNKRLKVAWFQGRNKIGTSIDYNRCILSKAINFNQPKIISNELASNNLMMRIRQANGNKLPFISPLNAYTPQQAINLFKKGTVDAVVLGNLIVTKDAGVLK